MFLTTISKLPARASLSYHASFSSRISARSLHVTKPRFAKPKQHAPPPKPKSKPTPPKPQAPRPPATALRPVSFSASQKARRTTATATTASEGKSSKSWEVRDVAQIVVILVATAGGWAYMEWYAPRFGLGVNKHWVKEA